MELIIKWKDFKSAVQDFIDEANDILYFERESLNENGLTNLETLIKQYSKGGTKVGKKALIIIDDCSAEQDLGKRRTSLSKIAFSGRHSNLTTWFITQRYVSVPVDFREQIRWILITKNTCRKSFELLMSENDVIPAEQLQNIKQKLKLNLDDIDS